MESIKQIKKICGKPAGPRKAKFYRGLSYYFTWIFLQLGLTANQVSMIGLLIGILSAICFLSNNHSLFIIGSISLFLSQMADYCDGEVARYRKYKEYPDELFREYGGFFDSLNHIAIPLVFICMSFSFINYHPLALVIGFLSAAFRLLNSSFYYWLKPIILLFNPNYKASKNPVAQMLVPIMYSSLLVPFMLLFTSILDFFFDLKLTFLLWIAFFLIGGIIFISKFGVKNES